MIQKKNLKSLVKNRGTLKVKPLNGRRRGYTPKNRLEKSHLKNGEQLKTPKKTSKCDYFILDK